MKVLHAEINSFFNFGKTIYDQFEGFKTVSAFAKKKDNFLSKILLSANIQCEIYSVMLILP